MFLASYLSSCLLGYWNVMNTLLDLPVTFSFSSGFSLGFLYTCPLFSDIKPFHSSLLSLPLPCYFPVPYPTLLFFKELNGTQNYIFVSLFVFFFLLIWKGRDFSCSLLYPHCLDMSTAGSQEILLNK